LKKRIVKVSEPLACEEMVGKPVYDRSRGQSVGEVIGKVTDVAPCEITAEITEKAYKKMFSPIFNSLMGFSMGSKLAVKIGEDGRCTCSCGDKCPLGKTGSELRCTEEELKAAGVSVIK